MTGTGKTPKPCTSCGGDGFDHRNGKVFDRVCLICGGAGKIAPPNPTPPSKEPKEEPKCECVWPDAEPGTTVVPYRGLCLLHRDGEKKSPPKGQPIEERGERLIKEHKPLFDKLAEEPKCSKCDDLARRLAAYHAMGGRDRDTSLHAEIEQHLKPPKGEPNSPELEGILKRYAHIDDSEVGEDKFGGHFDLKKAEKSLLAWHRESLEELANEIADKQRKLFFPGLSRKEFEKYGNYKTIQSALDRRKDG